MPAKPCLGYASRTDAVIALRAQGLDTRQIARSVGIDPSTVSALEANRRSARQRPTGRRDVPIQPVGPQVDITPDVLRKLRPHAARRAISVPTLVRQLLDIMLDDDLVDALLDDAEEIAA